MESSAVKWFCIIWIMALAAHTFFICPVNGAAATMWVLAAAPLLAVSLKPRDLSPCVLAAFLVLTIYACGVVFQELVGVRYIAGWAYGITPDNPVWKEATSSSYVAWDTSTGRSWPVLDPNNGALILNFGLLGSFYMALRNWKLWPLVGIFFYALLITHSNAGLLFGGVSCFILLCHRFRLSVIDHALLFVVPSALIAFILYPQISHIFSQAIDSRLLIWEGASRLITPFGLGLGSYSFYYPQVALEQDAGMWYAHNDLLQIFIEMGYLGLISATSVIAAVFYTTNRNNILSACMLLTALLQAMVEFQFYVPAVSILCGLALAHHLNNENNYGSIVKCH